MDINMNNTKEKSEFEEIRELEGETEARFRDTDAKFQATDTKF